MTITKNKPLLAGIAAAVIGIAAWLAFGFFGIQSAFIDSRVDEAGPVFAASVEQTAATDDAATSSAPTDSAPTDSAPTDTDMPDVDEAPASVPPTVESQETEQAEAPNEIVTQFSGEFSGSSRYDITGRADVLNNGTEQRFLRFEDFESSNGPDLKVYLRADNGDFVNLGDLKGNIGSQNYEIPADVDLSVFNRVEIWCERFSVGFGGADLGAV